MRLIKLSAALSALSIAIGVLAASTAYAQLPTYSRARAPFANETAVLTSQGISPGRASQLLSLQGQVAETHLVSKVEAALEGAYAGAWFEPGTATLHIGATSDANRQTVRRLVAEVGLTDDVVETPVRSTWAALIRAQGYWNNKLASLVANGEATTGIDAQNNAVSVTLNSIVPTATRAVLKRDAAADNVNVLISVTSSSTPGLERQLTKSCEEPFTTTKGFCEKTIISGVRVKAEGQGGCTAGPMLIEGNETYVLTAGHCFGLPNIPPAGEAVTAKLTSAYPTGGETQKEIGKEGWRYNGTQKDVAEIKVSATSLFREGLPDPVPALVAEWGRTAKTPHAVEGVKEAAEVVPRQVVCHEGTTSGEQCGEVLLVNVTGSGVEHIVETSACSEGGDSGGPYFFRTTTNELLMMGTHVGGTPSCPKTSTTRTDFEPLLDVGTAKGFGILSTFKGQELLTTKNEIRARNFECAQVTAGSGKYNEASCLKEGGTKEFEEKGITGARFTAKAAGTTVITASAKKVECTGATSEGMVTSSTEDVATIKYTGCTESPGSINCESTGAAAKEIVVPVSSKIVSYEGPSTNKAGLLVSPRNSAGENKTEFECAGTKVKVYGSVTGALTPGGEMSLSFTAKWQLNAAGTENTIKDVGNELRAKFGAAATEKATQTGEALLDFTLKVEIAP